MSKKGKLSLVEKAAIQSFVSEGKDIVEISKILDRNENTVSNYINVELDDLYSTIVRAKMEAVKPEVEENQRYSKARGKDLFNIREAKTLEIENVTDEDTVNNVMRRLSQAGLKETDVNKVISLSIEKFSNLNKRFKDEDELYTECIRQMRAGEFIIKKSQGGRDGVAIMTPAASQRSDGNKKPTTSRSVRNNVFKPNG